MGKGWKISISLINSRKKMLIGRGNRKIKLTAIKTEPVKKNASEKKIRIKEDNVKDNPIERIEIGIIFLIPSNIL